MKRSRFNIFDDCGNWIADWVTLYNSIIALPVVIWFMYFVIIHNFDTNPWSAVWSVNYGNIFIFSFFIKLFFEFLTSFVVLAVGVITLVLVDLVLSLSFILRPDYWLIYFFWPLNKKEREHKEREKRKKIEQEKRKEQEIELNLSRRLREVKKWQG